MLNTGYFGDGFKDWYVFNESLSNAILKSCVWKLSLTSYGANVTTLKATSLGETVPLAAIESVLIGQNYKLITVTHVDTSTGRSDIFPLKKKTGPMFFN